MNPLDAAWSTLKKMYGRPLGPHPETGLDMGLPWPRGHIDAPPGASVDHPEHVEAMAQKLGPTQPRPPRDPAEVAEIGERGRRRKEEYHTMRAEAAQQRKNLAAALAARAKSDDPQEEAWAHLLDEKGMAPRLNIPRKPTRPPAQQGGRQLTQSDKHSMISEAKMKPISWQLGRGEKPMDPFQSDREKTFSWDSLTPEEMLELYGIKRDELDEEARLEELRAQEEAQHKFDEEGYGRGRLDSTMREHGLV